MTMKQYAQHLYEQLGEDLELNEWYHNYYRFKRFMVSVYRDSESKGKFSIAVFKIRDLRRKYNWYEYKELEKDNLTLQEVQEIIEEVKER